MDVYNVRSYNGGLILQIFNENGTFYYFDATRKEIISSNSPSIRNLVLDDLIIDCASICLTFEIDCVDGALLTNAAFCLVTNGGDPIVGN